MRPLGAKTSGAMSRHALQKYFLGLIAAVCWDLDERSHVQVRLARADAMSKPAGQKNSPLPLGVAGGGLEACSG